MSDICTVWRGTNGDWSVDGADLLSGNDLETATIISVMTDRVLPDGAIAPDGSGDPRGWWGDDPAHLIGSRLWTLLRAQAPGQHTLADAHDFLAECLQWMIDDGVVQSWDIATQWNAQSFLAAVVIATKPDGTTQQFNFSWAWAALTT